MVGFFASADSTQPVRTDLDNELDGNVFFSFGDFLSLNIPIIPDARWFTREEVLSLLRYPDSFTSNRTGIIPKPSSPNAEPPLFLLPGTMAIAGVLVRAWAEGEVSGSTVGTVPLRRGNL
jgi:NAD+ diphosphatase